MNTVGERIAAARKEQGMTQEKLASELNVSRAAVSNWEKGRRLPDAEMMIRLSDLLHVDFLSKEGNAVNADDAPTGTKEPSEESPAEGKPAEEKPTADNPAEAPDTDKPENPAGTRRKWWIAAAALIVIAGLVLWLCLKPGTPQYKSDEGKIYTIEQLKENVPNAEGKPHLRIDLNKTFTEEYLMYAFQCFEVNGHPLDVTRVDLIYFKKDGTTPVEFYSDESLKKAGMDMHIPANGSWEFAGGMLETESQKAYGVGMILHATSEAGDPLTFTAFLPFT